MAEALTEIARRPPLGETAAELTAGIAPGVLDIRLLPPRARFTLRVAPALLPPGGEVAGFALDMAINRCRTAAQRMALRLGPDEWLLWAPEPEAAGVATGVAGALAGRHYSLVEIGQSRAAFAVSGTEAALVLNSGCPLDLSPAAFPAGAATRTLVGKCEVILARADDGATFEVECGRSFAPYLRDFLRAAARELSART
jgi:sarcosine oxidase, subunit gamma